jgi:hypothetical protein
MAAQLMLQESKGIDDIFLQRLATSGQNFFSEIDVAQMGHRCIIVCCLRSAPTVVSPIYAANRRLLSSRNDRTFSGIARARSRIS